MNEILNKFQICKNETDLYKKAVKIVDFMRNIYSGEDIRFVSAYLFGNSKTIDKNTKLRKLFNEFSSVRRPGIVYIRTDTETLLNGINVSELTKTLHLCAFFEPDIKTIDNEKCDIVISENLSFFMNAEPKNAIFLYSKGFHLIDTVADFIKKLDYKNLMHFGDVDCEGFAIFQNFKKSHPSIEFYPDVKTAEFVAEKYRNFLPENNQGCNNIPYALSNKITELIHDNVSIEQEFIHALIHKNILRKPEWMK